MKLLLIILFFISLEISLKANDTIQSYKSCGFVIGYQKASGNLLEFGFVREYGIEGSPLLIKTTNKTLGLFFNGHRFISINSNYNLDHKIFGFNIGFNQGGFGAYGLNINYYKFGSDYRLGIKPEIGIIINRFQLFYGYNFKISGKDLVGLSRHSLRLSCYFPIFGRMNTKTFEEEKVRKKRK
jgi:hypothetical protein